jgi:trehalose 6-phosphate phosphatase
VIDALSRLAALACTEVAIVSGRSLHDLEQFTGLGGVAHLVGSHGSEFEPGVVTGVREGDLAVWSAPGGWSMPSPRRRRHHAWR